MKSMIVKRLYYTFLLIALAFLAEFCANTGMPAGGPKDNDPPVIEEIFPANGSVHFKAKKFTVKFDEYIKPQGIAQKIVISPPIKKKPEIRMSGKTMIVDLGECWEEIKDSTTYVFDFSKAIADVNEGNELKDFRYIFSTGDIIDSLKISGRVLSAFDIKPEKEGVVIIYNANEYSDSVPMKQMPDYIAQIDEQGNFIATNIRKGAYKVLALNDKNNNLNFDLPTEKIAFLDTLVVPDVKEEIHFDTIKAGQDSLTSDSVVERKELKWSPDDIVLLMFDEEELKTQVAEKSRDEKWKLAVRFTNYLERRPDFYLLDADADSFRIVTEMNKTYDTVTVWAPDSALYSRDTVLLAVKYPSRDSLNNSIDLIDTLRLKQKSESSGKKDKKQVVEKTDTLIIKSDQKPKIDYFRPYTMELSHPVAVVDTALVQVFELKDTVEIPRPASILVDSLNPRRINIENKWIPGKNYHIVICRDAFKDIFGYVNDTVEFNFTTRSVEEYGTIILSLINSKENPIIQILDPKEKLIRELKYSGEMQVLSNLMPGKYMLKIVFDLNGNGKWDPGRLLNKLQPEEVYYYESVIEVKANWEMNLDLDIEKK